MKKLAVGVALTFVLGGGATAVLLVSFASSIYRRALLITGHRVKVHEMIRARRSR